MQRTFSEQEIQRRESLKKLILEGVTPYPSPEFVVSHTSKEIKKIFSEEEKKMNVSVAGRIMGRRIMGKAAFVEIQDSSGKIQLYFNRDIICPDENKMLYNNVFKKWLDIGDIVGIEGYTFKTKVGETSIYVEKFTLLCKSVRPLPIVKEKDGKTYDEFSDPEQRYRQRYVDLIVNPEIKKVFQIRTKLVNGMRHFFDKRGYLEVETPILQPIYGGASARPFKTYHNTLDQELYLRVANELYLKRLIVGGFDGVYEFSKDFRNEGMSRFHNPEFTQVELYVAYKDYLWMMNFLEELIETVCLEIHNTTKIEYGEKSIDFKRPWARFTMAEVIKKFTEIDISNSTEEELRKKSKGLGIEIQDSMGKGKIIDEIFGEKCEPHFTNPTIITDYPIEMSPLAKKHREKEGIVERFEVICNGKEICNAFSELNDPIDQRERLENQIKLGKRGDDEATSILDEDFLRALEYGMPPTVGIGIGIDRLCMIMTNQVSIQDVLFFPQMKQINTEATEK